MAPIAAGPAPSRNARTRCVVAQPIEVRTADEHERERGQKRDRRRQRGAADAPRGVADGGDGRDDRTRRHLAEGDGVQELGRAHPVVGVHGVGLHQRHDHESAAVGECADLERDPGECAEPADPGGGRDDDRRR